MAERIDVFVSSTSRDLIVYRDAVVKVILKSGMYPIDMATFNPTDRNALQLCYDKMQEAEIFIGIYAHRYGYAPTPDVTYRTVDGETLAGDDETSITHFEYLWAVNRNLPLLLFVIDETDSDGKPLGWPVEFIEDEPKKSRLKAFKELIGKNHVWGRFYSPDNLASQVASALLHELLIRSPKALSSKMLAEPDSGPRIGGMRPPDVATYFRDRESQVKEILELLMDSSTRVISVIGRGGIGKTALVSKVLRQLETHKHLDPDDTTEIRGIIYLSTRTRGITLERIFLDCAAVLDSEQREKILSIWTNSEINYREKYTHLFDMLNNGLYVLLLDNMEDVLDNHGFVNVEELRDFLEASLRNPHNMRFLITTREPLSFSRETMRFDKRVLIEDGLPEQDAIEVMRDLDPHGQYGLRDASDEQLRRIVIQVHRIPRALEIVASILANDPLTSIDELVNQDSLVSREEFIQELAQENYKRFDQDAHSILDALAVFSSPVPMSAVEFLLQPFMPEISVRNTLVRLIQIHTVILDRTTKLISLHPIDQYLVYGQLPNAISQRKTYTRSQLHQKAADYYESMGLPEDQWHEFDDLLPQILQFEHLKLAGNYDDAYDVLNSFEHFLRRNGYRLRLIDMHRTLVGNLHNSANEIKNITKLGRSLHKQGLSKEAQGYLLPAVQMMRDSNDRRALGSLQNILGNSYRGTREIYESIKSYEKVLEISKEIGDRSLEESAVINLAGAYRMIGETLKSLSMCYDAVKLSNDLESNSRLGVAVAVLSESLAQQGDYDAAFAAIEQSLNLATGKDVYATRIATRGKLRLLTGNFVAALDDYSKALETFKLYGNKEREILYSSRIAIIQLLLNRPDDAFKILDDSLLPRERTQGFRFLLLQGILLARLKETGKAKERLEDSLSVSNELLQKTDRYVDAMYCKALALLGLSVVYASEAHKVNAFHQSVEAYGLALKNCPAAGVIDEARLMLIQLTPIDTQGRVQAVLEILDKR